MRKYLDNLMQCIYRPAALYELHRCDGPLEREPAKRRILENMSQAKQLARNGLPTLGRLCPDLPHGWADDTIRRIDTLAILMDFDSWGDFPIPTDLDDDCELIFKRLLSLMESLPPEEHLPPDLEYIGWFGIRATIPTPESLRPCRVKIQGHENEKLKAILDDLEVEPPLTLKSYRALKAIIQDHLKGGCGLTMDELGNDRAGVSELTGKDKRTGKTRYPHWDAVLFRPGTRSRTGHQKRYGIMPAQSSQAA